MPDVVKIMMGLTGKEKPHFFLLPTAGRDGADEQNERLVVFRDTYGCPSRALFLTRPETTEDVIRETIAWADISLASGGNL